MKLISWNTNGLRATAAQGHFDPLFREFDPDILCLQETKATPDQLPAEVRDVFGYESYFHFPTVKKGYSGVGVYTKERPIAVTYGLGVPALDDEGRMITLEYGAFFLINCYFPNGGGAPERLEYKLAFYEQFLKYVNKLEEQKPVIWCGDVNVAHTEIDIARPKENSDHVGFLPVERAWMDKVIASGWVDVFRSRNPDARDVYTYWDQKSNARDRNVGWRIDYFLVSPKLIGAVTGFETLTDYYGSDHCPVTLDIAL